ncbi:fimbria/pilus outer membrane usher protein [Gallibacterium melopsittaci]|uniref:Fimbria/pilus outer membrane usher protein n=1 Tax=Gallibacterium melopsittaci TaxID=516063 RepID=A0ABV6HXX0_9PAST
MSRLMPIKNKFRLNSLYIALLSSLAVTAYADEYAEFDASFLRGGKDKDAIDISRFNYSNPTPAGEYVADVYLNNELRGRINLQFVEVPEKNKTAVCATEDLLAILDLKDDAFTGEQQREQAACAFLPEQVPEAKINFDVSELRLDVDVPQAFITQRPRGYISPAQWQDGVPVAFVRYDASHYRYQYADTDSQQTYLGIDAGINLFGWAFRHRGSQSWDKQQRLPYQSTSTYAQHDVAALRGQFTIGDFYTSGTLMDSLSIRGIQLASDDRMLASSVRGYAPIVRGVANSNARVSIRQNGNILREVTVPAGPFEIDDLYPTGYGGDIQVEILEANGERRSFTIPYTAVAQLIRPGYSRYQIAGGRYRYGNEVFDVNVGQATWQYGLTNNITFNVGGIFSKDYHAELVGFSFNTPIGAFATNATFSNATFRTATEQQKYKGYNLYASYNTRLEPTDTNVTLAAYRYLSRDYYSLQDVILANNRDFMDERGLNMPQNSYRPKNQFQVSISQNLKEGWGSMYLTGSTYTYWGTDQKQNEYQIGYSNHYKSLNYSFSFSQSKNSFGESDRRVYVSLSLPLGDDSSSAYLSQSLNYSKANGYSGYTSVSGALGEDRQYSYSVSASKQQDGGSNLSVSNSYSGSLAQVNASWGRDSNSNQQMSFGVSGAVVAHPKGITLSNSLGDSFAIIHADGAAGAKINGAIGNRIDYFGNGIVPYLEPYSVNYVGLDSNNIPDSVELSATEQQVIPRANQAMLIDFATTVGSVVFFELTGIDDLPPLGTEVFDQNNQSIGVVAQGGKIYTRGVAKSGELHIRWGDKQCRAEYTIPEQEENGQMMIVPVKCDSK